jgi:hypothetical protein
MKITLRIAAAACLLIPLAAQSANIQISSLPFAITAPGTYVVTGDLTFSSPPQPNGASVAAITISTALSGPVVVDLKGLALIVEGDEKGWGILGWEDNAKLILTEAINSANRAGRNIAIELIHKLGSRGYFGYKELLPR